MARIAFFCILLFLILAVTVEGKGNHIKEKRVREEKRHEKRLSTCRKATCAEAGELCADTTYTSTSCQDSYCKYASSSSNTVCAALIPNGGACGDNYEGSESATCESGFCGYNELCMNFGAEKRPGDSCIVDYECVYYAGGKYNSTCVNGKCYGLQNGASCDYDWTQCDGSTLYCGGSYPSYSCRPYTKVGQSCSSYIECEPPSQCNSKDICALPLAQGSLCDDDYNDCEAGYDCIRDSASGPAHCAPLFSVKAGGWCSDSDQCADLGRCKNNVCSMPTAWRANVTCTDDDSCLISESCECNSGTGSNTTGGSYYSALGVCVPIYNSDYINPDMLGCYETCLSKNFLSEELWGYYYDATGFQNCLTSTCSKSSLCTWYQQLHLTYIKPLMADCEFKAAYGPFVDKCGSAASVSMNFALAAIAMVAVMLVQL